jgi:hypothetical protein
METNEPEKQNIVTETLSNVQAASLYSVAVWALGILAGVIALLGSLAPFFGGTIPDQAWNLAGMAVVGLVGLLGANKAAA